MQIGPVTRLQEVGASPAATSAQLTFDEYAKARLPQWLRFARALCADSDLAQDILQDVLIKLHAKWSSVEVMTAPDAYVRRMVVNEFFSWRRKWSRIAPHDDPARLIRPDSSEQDGDMAAKIADRDELLLAIRRLPARQRAVIGLRYFADFDDAEIADALGCKRGTVRVHAARALATLRITRGQSALGTEGGDPQ
jgi:RNA polymerase sigma-70 factor (sigma-E family)